MSRGRARNPRRRRPPPLEFLERPPDRRAEQPPLPLVQGHLPVVDPVGRPGHVAGVRPPHVCEEVAPEVVRIPSGQLGEPVLAPLGLEERRELGSG